MIGHTQQQIGGSQKSGRTGTKTMRGIGSGILLLAAVVIAAIELLVLVSDEGESTDEIDEDAAY